MKRVTRRRNKNSRRNKKSKRTTRTRKAMKGAGIPISKPLYQTQLKTQSPVLVEEPRQVPPPSLRLPSPNNNIQSTTAFDELTSLYSSNGVMSMATQNQ